MAASSSTTPSDPAHVPPKFTINLSDPPERRYAHLTAVMLPCLQEASLPALFADLVTSFAPGRLGRFLLRLAPLVLRKLYSDEETAELRAMARATTVPLHVLVAFNAVLDLLLGCTSGGIRVAGRGGLTTERMLHFRTLDWGMDPLRRLVVELNFVRRADGPVMATSVTYFGYVGVLTGVRRGLSMSLNFRPHHDRVTLRMRAAFRWHQLLVLFGFRRSIASVLRQCLLTPDP